MKRTKLDKNGDFAKKFDPNTIIYEDDPRYVEYYKGCKIIRGCYETDAPIPR